MPAKKQPRKRPPQPRPAPTTGVALDSFYRLDHAAAALGLSKRKLKEIVDDAQHAGMECGYFHGRDWWVLGRELYAAFERFGRRSYHQPDPPDDDPEWPPD